MPRSLLIANRGEIAIRDRAHRRGTWASRRSRSTPRTTRQSLHTRQADRAVGAAGGGRGGLSGRRRRSSRAAQEAGCDAVHPGYGFLSENAAFAAACADGGPDLRRAGAGDAGAVRRQGRGAGAGAALRRPGAGGTQRGRSRLEEARAFLAGLGDGRRGDAEGGGRRRRARDAAGDAPGRPGRGLRALRLGGAGRRSASARLYVEELLPRARHVEVQIVGDGTGAVATCGTASAACSASARSWSRSRRRSACPTTSARGDAGRRGGAGRRGATTAALGTIEFLVEPGRAPRRGSPSSRPTRGCRSSTRSPRRSPASTWSRSSSRSPTARRWPTSAWRRRTCRRRAAWPCRRGSTWRPWPPTARARPAGGVLTAYDQPSGPGVRVDGFGYAGYAHQPAVRLAAGQGHRHAAGDLAAAPRQGPPGAGRVQDRRRAHQHRVPAGPAREPGAGRAASCTPATSRSTWPSCWPPPRTGRGTSSRRSAAGRAGPARGSTRSIRWPCWACKAGDGPDAGAARRPGRGADFAPGPEGTAAVPAPHAGHDDQLRRGARATPCAAGQPVAVMEALKMEHVVARRGRRLRARRSPLEVGDTIFEGTPILFIEPARGRAAALRGRGGRPTPTRSAPTWPRSCACASAGHATRAARPPPASGTTGQRTTRENIDDLLRPRHLHRVRRRRSPPPGCAPTAARPSRSGSLQHRRRRHGHRRRPGQRRPGRPGERPVRGGGLRLHRAGRHPGRARTTRRPTGCCGSPSSTSCPVVLTPRAAAAAGRRLGPAIPEGAAASVGGLSTGPGASWGSCRGWCRSSASPPATASPATSSCWAACDVIIATRDSYHRHRRPGHDRGRRAGRLRARARSGRSASRSPTASSTSWSRTRTRPPPSAKQYLSYFQGRAGNWTAHDQRPLRHIVPENRRAVYDIRTVIETLADAGSVLELRPRSATSMVTALIRVEGRPVGVIANNSNSPSGGAIDSDGADKAVAVHAAVRRLRHPDPVADRHPGQHGRPGGREDRADPALRADVRGRRQPDRAALHRGPAQGLRPGRHRHGRRQLRRDLLLRLLADRRVRRHGPGGLGQARPPRRAGGHHRHPGRAGPATTSWSPTPTPGPRR